LIFNPLAYSKAFLKRKTAINAPLIDQLPRFVTNACENSFGYRQTGGPFCLLPTEGCGMRLKPVHYGYESMSSGVSLFMHQAGENWCHFTRQRRWKTARIPGRKCALVRPCSFSPMVVLKMSQDPEQELDRPKSRILRVDQ
jgi:hypothetical protein